MTKQHSARSVFIVVVDRLGSGFVGPYGNTWIETPALNRLASESLLLENLVVDSPELKRAYRSFWSGHHAMDCSEVLPEASLAALGNRQGLKTVLLTDEQAILEHPLAAPFQDHIFVDHAQASTPADSIAETALAQVFSAGLDLLASSEQASLIWLHARGMQDAWDAPLALREPFRGEEDPLPYAVVESPRNEIGRAHV